jgi:hypothetical protein
MDEQQHRPFVPLVHISSFAHIAVHVMSRKSSDCEKTLLVKAVILLSIVMASTLCQEEKERGC